MSREALLFVLAQGTISAIRTSQDSISSSAALSHTGSMLHPIARQQFDALMHSAFSQLQHQDQQTYLDLVASFPGATPAVSSMQVYAV